MNTFYPLTIPTWGDEEKTAIDRVISSGRITMGDEVEAFEHEFAEYHGRKHGIMVNSGSSANLIATASLFFKKDNPLQQRSNNNWNSWQDEAIVPAIAWGTTYHPLHQYGLKMRVVDIELNTLNIDVSQLEQALTPHTRLLVAVSILGNPAALDVMLKFADEHNLYLLEDNCESLDAELGERKTGTFGHVSTFSFFYSHQISTGEGGMVLTDDDELAVLARCLRAHGWTRDISSELPSEIYHFILPGYNVRPLEITAAIGREQLKKLPSMTKIRRDNLAFFQSLFGNDKRFIIPRTDRGKSSSFAFPIIINPSVWISSKQVTSALTAAGIEFRMITGGNILRHAVSNHYKISLSHNLANADLVHDWGFFVGNYPIDLTPQITHLREVLDQVYHGEST